MAPVKPGGMVLTDLPSFARNELGIGGLILTTDLLAGADRNRLSTIVECADKAGCPVLALMETNDLPIGDMDDRKADAAIDRALRVAQAAHWLGCSAFSIPMSGDSDEDTIEIVAERLKLLARKSEKLDLNMCIAPRPGLTETPDRVGELLKRIGGFRIGTLPDFAAAAMSPDPLGYLRRLVPYASVVLATGMDFAADARGGFAPPRPPEPPSKPRPKRGKGKLTLESPASRDHIDDDESLPGVPSQPPALLKHGAYDLIGMSSVLVAVGFEGPIAIDVRGMADPISGIHHIRSALEQVFNVGISDDILDDLLAGEGELDEEEKL